MGQLNARAVVMICGLTPSVRNARISVTARDSTMTSRLVSASVAQT
jgi:hypothetical protein